VTRSALPAVLALAGYVVRDASELPASASTSGIDTWVIASEAVPDRMRDIVEQDWRLENYRSNPVILWGHDSTGLPVGRASSIGVVEGRLLAGITWDRDGVLGGEVARMFDEGWLNAVSVGFRPGKVQHRSDLDESDPRRAEQGFVLSNNELLEISAVAIPALQTALAQRALATAQPAAALAALISDLRTLATRPSPDPLAVLFGIRSGVAPTPPTVPGGASSSLRLDVRAALLDLVRTDREVQRSIEGLLLASPESRSAEALWTVLGGQGSQDS
jgi:HK97 family phage prohead protease